MIVRRSTSRSAVVGMAMLPVVLAPGAAGAQRLVTAPTAPPVVMRPGRLPDAALATVPAGKPGDLPRLELDTRGRRGFHERRDARFGGCGLSCACIGSSFCSPRDAFLSPIGVLLVGSAYHAGSAFAAQTPSGEYAPATMPAPSTSGPKLIVVGEGSGGESITLEHPTADRLRVTWSATGAIAREVRLFLADSARQTLRTSVPDVDAPTATFQIGALGSRIAFVGATVVFVSGVTTTTLVPYVPSVGIRRSP